MTGSPHIGGDARIVTQEHAVFRVVRRVFSGGFFRLCEVRIGCRAGGRVVAHPRYAAYRGLRMHVPPPVVYPREWLPSTHARIARVTLCPPKPREFESPSLLGVPSAALNVPGD